mgnify:CR=1 FL=1
MAWEEIERGPECFVVPFNKLLLVGEIRIRNYGLIGQQLITDRMVTNL